MNNSLINTAQINCARINSARVSGVGTPSSRSDKPVLDPALKAKLVAVWNPRGKTNEDADRAVIRDLTGHGNDLEILNAAYKLNSGHGEYKNDFTDSTKWQNRPHNKVTPSKIEVVSDLLNDWVVFKYVAITAGMYPSFKIKVTGLKAGKVLQYVYGVSATFEISKDGIYTLPEGVVTSTTYVGFRYKVFESTSDGVGLVIEQIPEYQGAVVTDGVDDMIVSKKPVSEMLEGSNEFTVIGIIRTLKQASYCTINMSTTNNGNYKRNKVESTGLNKIGIFGYSGKVDTPSAITTINGILGDKADYQVNAGTNVKVEPKYYITGYTLNGTIVELSSIAYYGGFIAKGVLTTDQINQVIAYYNLDWWIEPDGWYDVAKQGITNENHATFNDKLIDYSGNGRDLQCNNFGWGLNSGVGKWGIDFNDMVKSSSTQLKGCKIEYTVSNDRFYPLYFRPTYNVDVSSFVVNCDFDGTLYYYYINDKGIRTQYILNKGINVLPKSIMSLNPGTYNCGFYAFGGATFGVIEQLPEVEGGLWHDGVDDNCASVVNFPAYKDFTVVVDRCLEDSPAKGAVISKGATTGAFMFDYSIGSYQSFGGSTAITKIPIGIRKTSYLTKYSSLEVHTIVPGENVDKEFHIATGTFRRGDTRFSAFGLYGFLVYPYSMNEFLIERQLKKRKFGTLYPKT